MSSIVNTMQNPLENLSLKELKEELKKLKEENEKLKKVKEENAKLKKNYDLKYVIHKLK